MTIEENQKLRKMLSDMGYNIKSFNEGKLYWVARLNYPDPLSIWNGENLKLVDSSYENMEEIKYRTKLDGCEYYKAYKEKKMHKCTVDEILRNIRKIEEQIKIKYMKKKMDKINGDFE